MSTRRLTPGGLALLIAAVSPALAPVPAAAQTSDAAALKLQCVQASDKAQQLRVAGKLVQARDTLRTCVQDACPSVVREACSQWLNEVNASLPSIVIGAKDSDGKDILDLKVSIDGEVVSEHLGGRALPIDPGRHKMRYEKADGTVLEEDILVGEGTKNREVTVVFPGPKKPTPAAGGAGGEGLQPVAPVGASKGASAGNTAFGTVLAVVGAGALGTALYLDLSTTSDINNMRSTCAATAPNCPQSRVDSDRLDYDLAAVGLGVGVVAVGLATYIFLGHPFGSPAAEPSPAKQASRPSFRVVPSPHGSGFALTF